MRSLLVAFLLLVCVAEVFSQSIYNECLANVMSGFDPNDFYSTPQDEILSFCPQSSGDTCCTREYSEEIGDLSDPFSTSFRAVIPHPITTCRDALQQISCIMCSPAQTDWIYVNADFSTLVMCETFCESVYDACSTQNTVNDTSVAETYAQERDFCLALFDDLSHSETPVKIIIDQHNRECWNNLPECTQDSFYRLYTECVNGRRNMIWVKKPEVQCAGGLDDPQNEHDLPCAATCPAGERTKEQGETGDGDCVTCPAGTYSLGSDILEDSWSSPDDLVLQFHSYCTWTDGYGVERVWTETECRWNLNYGQISSPTSLNDSMSAYLETSVTLLADGEFIFSAKSDSELNFDGLRIFVDRVVVSDIGLISHTKEFQTYRVPLQQGYHYIQLVYYKDISVSVGLDQATINMIEVTNVRYASDYCTPCAPGKHSSEPGQRTCTPCEFFTYSDTEGAVQCTPCPEGTYSLDGYTECLPRPPCEDDAMYYRYGPCFYDAEEDGPRRYATAHWVEPHICDQDQLPEDELVLCPPCEPGMYRDQNGVDCYFCEEGTYSVGDDSPCVSCEAGHEAVRNLVFDEFNDFYYGLSTSCQYDCNTAGWVLREDAVDSGTGHGTYVVSTLTFEQSFPEAGTIAFEYSLICIESCLLTFQSDTADINPYRSFGGGFTINPTNIRLQFEVPAGNHTFNWVFTRDDRVGDGTNDRAQINYISARNTAEGGAVDCTPCEPGYYNPNTNQVNCIAAAPGFYATGGTSYQTQCEGNTYTDKEGQHTCSECGENVQALPGNTGCDITCSLELDDLIFNLSPMARNDSEMYGPIWDSRNNTYYLNMCDKQHNGHTCFDISNQPLETYVCQVTDIGIGQDLGSTFGILPLREAYYPEYTVGVTVHLTNGSPCHNGTQYFNRQAYIDVICDPYAGVGSPASLFENVETEKCVYQFQWSSLYGCPVCQESDYHYIASECEDGVSTLTYEWNSNPKTCHGGVTLPEPQEVACTGSTYCGPGQYFDSVDGECEDAPRGFYSVGNGIRVSSWTELENGFTSNGWIQSEKFISSGIGETSLLYVQNFVRGGTIEITFSVDNYGDSTARFRIYIDDVLEGNEIYSTNNEFITRTIHIPTGYHYIKFAFVAGTLTDTNTRGRGVKVKEMTILGFNWASSYPIPCPAGTFADEPASTRCQDCGWNTHSYEASSHCMGCPTDEYAFPGSQDCSPRELCTLSDYNLIYTTCQDGEQQASYSLIEPSICKEEEPPTPIDETVECFPCEAGLYREAGTDDECKSCPIGKYWDAEKEKCKSAKPGNAALLEKSYFTSPLPGDHLPSEFTTGCDGDCFCSSANCENDGWRFRGSFVDSGIYENRQVDVFLDLTLDLINAGQISFNYEVLGQSSNGLEFFVNNKQIDIPYHASAQHQKSMSHVSIDIGEGPNVFRWNYHQEANTMGSVQLSSIIIEGIGGSTGETICPAGEYSEDSESSYCTPCPPGTANAEEGATGCNVCGENQFSIVEGSTECLECGSGTQANADRTDCETDCIFTFDGDVYDISYLQSTHGPFAIDDGETGVWMNVCKKRSSNSFCLDPYGNSIETYMCEVDTRGNGIDYGNFLSVDLVEVEGSPEKAVRLSYSVVGDDDDSSCHSTVTVICDPDSSIQVPFLIGNPSDCDLHMRWNSAHGCRVCTDDDYEEQESECDDGKQTINSVRKTNCFGPVIRSTTEESCPTRYSFSLAVIIVVVILVVVLIIIIVAAVAYNRRLHGQYVALVRDSEGQYEMENMDEDTTVSDDKEKEEEPKPDAEAV